MPIGSVSWLEEGMLRGEIRSVAEGWEFDIRNQLFHGSKPLGWIRRWVVAVDDERIAEDQLEVILRDQRFAAQDARTVSEVWWYPRELLTIRVRRQPMPTTPVDVRVELHLSTFFFTPEIDRDDVYPSLPLVLNARMTPKENS